MEGRQGADARVGELWGTRAVVLVTLDGEPIRAPLPDQIAGAAVQGRPASVYLGARDRLEGWALPEQRVGVRMYAGQAEAHPGVRTFDCQGPCQTLWYLVPGGQVPAPEGCLACGWPTEAT